MRINKLNKIQQVKAIKDRNVTSQDVGQLRGRLEGLLSIASKITGFFRAFVTKA
jgi:hypothetical protein